MNTQLNNETVLNTTLALCGGKPVLSKEELKNARLWPIYGEEEIAGAIEVMQRPADKIYGEMQTFEQELCAYFGSKYALSTNTGTAALNTAAFAIGLQKGDEVIVPSYTYWATTLLTQTVGAVPVFVDCESHTANLDPALIEAKITSRTKAISVVHLWGMPADMDGIMSLAKKYNLRVIEDCSHAHGAEYRGKKIGTIGDIGCFSLQNSKLMPAMEGGFLLTNNRDYHARSVAFGHYGRVPEDHEMHRFNATSFGNKYRIHPISCKLGRLALKKLDARNKVICDHVEKIKNSIRGLKGITLFEVPSHISRVYYQFEICYDESLTGVKKGKIIQALVAEGAWVGNERYPIQHQQNIYKEDSLWSAPVKVPDHLPVTESIHSQILELPIFAFCEEKVVDQYIAAFHKVWSQLSELKS